MEGDTPSYLGLTQNGLASDRNPSWGGWGGRYVLRQSRGETRPIWTQGGDEFSRVTSRDTVKGVDGVTYISDQATIWRWRPAFQNEFAARMDWTFKPFRAANHNPRAVINGDETRNPIFLKVKAGKRISLDATGSYDPDGNRLHYHWFHYLEAGYEGSPSLAEVVIANPADAATTVLPLSSCRKRWNDDQGSCQTRQAHIILEVTDEGSPALTSYRRVVLSIEP